MKNPQQQQRIFEERAVADLNASLHLPEVSLNRWSACKSTHRFMAFKGKKLVAYRLCKGKPEVIDTFTCEGLDVSLASGLSSLWRSEKTSKDIWVSNRPKEVADGCFMWTLKYSSLEYVKYGDTSSLRFSLAYRTMDNPMSKVEGLIYLLEKNVFDNFVF